MSYIMVDIEADGPAPGPYSMVCFGAVVVREGLKDQFYGETSPISTNYDADALAVSGITREEHRKFPTSIMTMNKFRIWINKKTVGQPMFISDNNGFDWQFINYYFWANKIPNPFGHSSTNLGSLYKGIQRDMFINFKHLRITKHTHNPVDDAKGNAEALLYMKEHMHLSIKLT